jgi:DNA-binding transcriptional LysR family regulator
MGMDWQQLVTFERIVREGSFNRVARALDLSQAAISGRVKALEAEIGGPLFVRGGRRATLTEAGENFAPYARRALAVLAEGVEAARGAHTGQEGRVAVGAVDSIVDGLLVPVVARYQAAYPQVALTVRTGHTPQILQELADGIVRLGLVTWSYLTGTVEVEVLARFREPLIAVVAPAHPLAGRAALTVADVVREGAPYHETVWGTPEDARIAPTSGRGWDEHELPHSLMRQLILRGSGAGFLPATLVADDLAAGRLVALPLADAEGLMRELALIRHAHADALPAAAQAFVAAVRAEAVPKGTM